MAKQENNIVMKNTSGMFGDQVVFRQRAGETILAAPPIINPNRPITADEELVRDKFKLAVRNAKTAVTNPVKKAAYQAMAKPGQSAFNVAFTDAYFSPEIMEVDSGFYNGVIGDKVTVKAVDNIKVASVFVSVRNAGDVVIEEGNAVDGMDGITWIYTATLANANLNGKFRVTAKDIAGNETILEFNM
jgi:hypothetical protein